MFTLRIETWYAAFGESPEDRDAEIARILRLFANELENGEIPIASLLRDMNGNNVGETTFFEP